MDGQDLVDRLKVNSNNRLLVNSSSVYDSYKVNLFYEIFVFLKLITIFVVLLIQIVC